jgi:predicted amidohydrolase YtcJ
VSRRLLAAGAALALSLTLAQAGQPSAETIFVGNVLTLEPAMPRAGAVAVRGESILAVGTREQVLRTRGAQTRVVDLAGGTLLPGFIDAHSHLTGVAMALRLANLAAPPAGPVRSIAELQAALRAYIAAHSIPPGAWVIGAGYDDSLLAERRHPTRDELDAVSSVNPIFIVHVSGHLSVANSALLSLAGIGPSTPDPQGGLIRRRANSREPDGVLEESAHMTLWRLAPRPDGAEFERMIQAALDYYASFGITTVEDGAIDDGGLAQLEALARAGGLPLDVVTERLWMPGKAALPSDRPFGVYRSRLKVDGVKIILDGSPQGKTAWLTKPYLVPPRGAAADYRGYPAMPPEVLETAVHTAMAHNVTLHAHANGDAAADALIEAVEKARRETGNLTSKVVMIHAQTVRDDQLKRMKDLGILPSFFVAHTFYWGDWHRDETLGVARAARLSPARSALAYGLDFTLHNDSPVVPPDILRTLWSATTRRTRSNDILGPRERLTVAQALAAVTSSAAAQYGEQSSKGSIAVGKLADFVVLSADPLASDPERLLEIRVLKTISHGRTVFPREQAPTR